MLPLIIAGVEALGGWEVIGTAAVAIGAFFGLGSTAGCKKPETAFGNPPSNIPPIDPPDGGTTPNPPGNKTVYRCDPPNQSLLWVIKGYNASSPVRGRDAMGNATSTVSPGPGHNVCSVWAVDRLTGVEGERTDGGMTPYHAPVQWANSTSPFPPFPSDPSNHDAVARFNCAQVMDDARTGEQTLSHVYRGCPPPATDDIRKEGSWSDVLTLAGLPGVGERASFAFFADMNLQTDRTPNPSECRADITLRQQVRTPDGSRPAGGGGSSDDDWVVADAGTPDGGAGDAGSIDSGATDGGTIAPENFPTILPVYREEACAAALNFPGATRQSPITICDNDGTTPPPSCDTLGMTSVDKLEAIPIILPLSTNADAAMNALANGASASGMLYNAEDEGVIVLRSPFSFSIPIRATAMNSDNPDGGQ